MHTFMAITFGEKAKMIRDDDQLIRLMDKYTHQLLDLCSSSQHFSYIFPPTY